MLATQELVLAEDVDPGVKGEDVSSMDTWTFVLDPDVVAEARHTKST